MSRSAVAAMTAYTLELHEAKIKLNQNESPFDAPREWKEQILARFLERPWNRYPDFEATALRTAIAGAYGLGPENILVGNGSNELLAAAIGAFVGPETPVIFPRPTFTLYEKLITVAGGMPVPIEFEPDSGLLPLEPMLEAIDRHENAVVIACSPNNPTGGVLPAGGLDALLKSGAMVLFDQAYGDFDDPSPAAARHPLPAARGEENAREDLLPAAQGEGSSREDLLPAARGEGNSREDLLPAARGEGNSREDLLPAARGEGSSREDLLPARGEKVAEGRMRGNLVTFRTFSKAWGLAGLRVGWCASTAKNCREIRKVKLPYSLNILSEAIAAEALNDRARRDATVAHIVAERRRLFIAMRGIPQITVFPSRANFITFRTRKPLFEPLVARGILVRDVSAYPRLQGCLRVSIGTAEQNDAFLTALKEIA